MMQPDEKPGSRRDRTDQDDIAPTPQGPFGSTTRFIKEKAGEFAEEQKEAGVEKIEAVSRAVHGAADEVGKEAPEIGRYIHSAAETLESAAAQLNQRSIDDFVGGFSRFARDQPAAAFAGCVLAGFALSRFLKSSAP
jgi:hypothetical protein